LLLGLKLFSLSHFLKVSARFDFPACLLTRHSARFPSCGYKTPADCLKEHCSRCTSWFFIILRREGCTAMSDLK